MRSNSLRISCSAAELFRHNDLDRHVPPHTAPSDTTTSPRATAEYHDKGDAQLPTAARWSRIVELARVVRDTTNSAPVLALLDAIEGATP